MFTGDPPSLESRPRPRRTICSCGTPSRTSALSPLEMEMQQPQQGSIRSAQPSGFVFNGEDIFHERLMAKEDLRNAFWYSIIDTEWPALKRAYEEWLDPANFDDAGQQRRRLEEIRAGL